MSQIIMPDTIRKTLFNSYSNTVLKLNIKAKMSYSENQPRAASVKNSLSGGEARENRSSSLNAVHGSVFKNLSPLKKYINSPKKSTDKLEKLLNNGDSCIPVSLALDVSNSFIDPILNENTSSAYLEELINEFNTNADNFEITEDSISNKQKAKELIRGLFGIQEAYSNQFNAQVSLHKEFKSLLVNYNEKYRTIGKKTNKLKETLETYDMKNNLCTNINREENKRVTERIDDINKELGLYKSLFRIPYTQQDINDYTEMKSSEDIDKEKNILLKAFQNLIRNKALHDRDEDRKAIVENILENNNLYQCLLEEENNTEEKVNKIVLDDDEDDEEPQIEEESKEQENNFKVAENNNQSPKKANKRLTLINSERPDETDHKLDHYLVNYYNKKRISQIPLRRLSSNNYEFGTQKIHVKCEGETIRGIIY